MKSKIKVVPVIPSLNPDQKLIEYVSSLIKFGFEKIIIVNDGSNPKHDKYFEKIIEKKCIVLRHTINKGKGRVLKTTFNYYLKKLSNYDGVVTADSDGQFVNLFSDVFENIDTIGSQNLYKVNKEKMYLEYVG